MSVSASEPDFDGLGGLKYGCQELQGMWTFV